MDDGAESKFGACEKLIVLNIFNYEYCVYNKSCDMSQQQYNNTFIRLVLNYIHEREKTYIYIYLFVLNKAWS